MNKIKFFVLWFFTVCLIILLLVVISNKSKKSGNNTNEDVRKYILNINSYNANITVKEISNKNDNEYNLKQEVREDYEKQIGISPKEIEGVEIVFQDNTLKLSNLKIKASKVYSEYKMIYNNCLFLTDFIKNYKESKSQKYYEKDNLCYFEFESDNKYNNKLILSVNKQTLKPVKMEVYDNNNKIKVYILYNEIEINIWNKCISNFINGEEIMLVRRGDMFYADLSPVIGSEQGGIRPVIIIQNDVGNKYSPTVIAAAITSKLGKTSIPTHIEIGSQNDQLKVDSMVLAEQVRTIDKSRLKEKIGHIEDKNIMNKIDNALVVSIGLQSI